MSTTLRTAPRPLRLFLGWLIATAGALAIYMSWGALHDLALHVGARAREATVAFMTQGVAGEERDLARHAVRATWDEASEIVGKKRVEDLFDRYVRPPAQRLFDRSDRAHEAVHQRIMLEALRQLPTPLLERVAEGTIPELEMACDGHVYRMPVDKASAEARRILDARSHE